MAKFMKLPENKVVKKEFKETVFNYCIGSDFEINSSEIKPSTYRNILHIGYDISYGDVFKCWDNDPSEFTIHFGVKGDENYESI